MASSPPFVLSRASASDMEEMVNLQYDAFPGLLKIMFMGCYTKADLPKLREFYLQRMADPSDLWIKVVDNQTGKIVAASRWRVFANGVGSEKPAESPPEWLEGEDLERSRWFCETWNRGREKHMGGKPHIHLNLMFTDANYQRQGAASMMMKWGMDLADHLGVPCWIEASADGTHLYKTFDFHWVEDIKVNGEVWCVDMKRDARELSIGGGYAKKS